MDWIKEAFIEGYKQRAEASDLIFDNASRMYAIALFDKWKSKQLSLTDVGCSLPSKNERVTYCNDLANKHGVTEIFKKETLIKGFHLGYRYAKSFIK